MEVLSESDSPVLLSNAEVLTMLTKNIGNRKELEAKQKRRRKDKKSSKFAHRDWIEEQVHNYLQRTPCIAISDTSKLPELKSKLTASKKQQNKDGSKKATGFNLTEAEAVQIVNFMPTEPVEIHLMVEEMHARMSEDRQGELLALIASYRKDGDSDSTDENAMNGVEETVDDDVVGFPVKTESEL